MKFGGTLLGWILETTFIEIKSTHFHNVSSAGIKYLKCKILSTWLETDNYLNQLPSCIV